MLKRTSNLDTVEGPTQWKTDLRHGDKLLLVRTIKESCRIAIHLVEVQVSWEKGGTE
jgi:hypothetical protein